MTEIPKGAGVNAGVNTYLTTRAAECPACHVVLNGATGVRLDATRCPPPSAGDLTVCGECTALLAWTEEGGFRFATQEELDALEPILRNMIMELNGKPPGWRRASDED